MDRTRRDYERALAGGEIDAAAHVLAERVRSGSLGRGWLHLIYVLGDPGAARYLGLPAPVPVAPHRRADWFDELINVWGERLRQPALTAANELLAGTEAYRPFVLRDEDRSSTFFAICTDLRRLLRPELSRQQVRARVVETMSAALLPWVLEQGPDPADVDPQVTGVLCYLASGRYPERSRELLRLLGLERLSKLYGGYHQTDVALPRGLGDYAEALEVRFGVGVEAALAACASARTYWEAELGDWAPVQRALDALDAHRRGRRTVEELRGPLQDVVALAGADEEQAAIARAIALTGSAVLGPEGHRQTNAQQAVLRLADLLGDGFVADAIERRLRERAVAGRLVFDDVPEPCGLCCAAPCLGGEKCYEGGSDGVETRRWQNPVAL